MNNGIKIDDKQVMNALGSISVKSMNKAYSQGMKKALDPILKQTKTNLRKSGIRNVSKPYTGKDGRKYKSMIQGIKTSVFMKSGDGWGKVHIMGEFRLKWFEKGTQLRKTDKGYNRGKINPKWFFKSAFESKSRQAEDTLEDNIKLSIMKAWNKK